MNQKNPMRYQKTMISADECMKILTTDWIDSFYFPHIYLNTDGIHYAVQHHNWMILPSEMAGWVLAKRRRIVME